MDGVYKQSANIPSSNLAAYDFPEIAMDGVHKQSANIYPSNLTAYDVPGRISMHGYIKTA